jgi:predicted ATPase
MDARLKKVCIKNFRSLADVTLELNPGINVLAGPNASGKSNILRAISRSSNKYNFSINDQARFSSESLSIEYTTVDGSKIISTPQGISLGKHSGGGLQNSVFYMDALRGYPNQSLVPKNNHSLRSDGSNLAGALHYFRGSVASTEDLSKLIDRVRQLTSEISQIRPDFKGEDTAELFIWIKRDNQTFPFLPENLATGTLDAVFIALILQNMSENSVLLLDCPDSHLHAGSQESLMEILRDVSDKENKQIIIATHSPFIVDMCSTSEVFLVMRRGFVTSVEKVSDKSEIVNALETTDTQLSDITSSMRKV